MTKQNRNKGAGILSDDSAPVPRFDFNTDEREYFLQLALDIVAHGGFGDSDPAAVVRASHERRQAFMAEVIDGKTERGRGLVKALRAAVFLQEHWNVQMEERRSTERRNKGATGGSVR